ncbi:hypothetical protein ALQ37_200126 [Pseudomonas syringae pv. aptata]|uniref:Uncharacterized protein n=2 Tax=Pseudomonas syringae TaxID=317 RepID=A0A0Q0BTA2_PSEAP|nr:Uncharacterized protein ALO85_04163 [Pseudomonas syringae pv. aptata]RMO65372.1 hypothetical protein ALQ37_200126 [Pseudomonas syringae pv. aptata]
MSTRLTLDEKNDLINEAMKSSIRHNAEVRCESIDGGSGLYMEGYYLRYKNDKDKIIKAAGIDASRVTPEENIENILIGKEIISEILNKPEFSRLQSQIKDGHLSIDISTPVTSLKFSDEIANHVGKSKALAISERVNADGRLIGLDYFIPALEGSRSTLGTALKDTSDYVKDVLGEIKNKAVVKQEEKPVVRAKLKM